MEDPVTTDEPLPKLEGDLAAQERAKALVGRVISDRYRIAELLAMGGMGAVYRGEHVLLKKRIAIKILHPDIENLPELVTRFEREAIVGAHIQHPNVAAATDFGKLDDGSFFLVLEYVRGKTLYHVIKKGPLEPRRVVHIGRQIASALHALHKKGVIHRDLKPRNIMLLEGQKDVAKLIDFGLAKVSIADLTVVESLRSPRLDEAARRARSSDPDKQSLTNEAGDRLTGVGVIFGTIAYLAPEAAFGMDAVDARADLYALGLILYEMLSGLHPFQANDAVELFKHQRYTKPPTLEEKNPDVSVPAALAQVVMRLLEKDPFARFQTAKEVLRALEAPAVSPEGLPALEVESVELPTSSLLGADAAEERGSGTSPEESRGAPPEDGAKAKGEGEAEAKGAGAEAEGEVKAEAKEELQAEGSKATLSSNQGAVFRDVLPASEPPRLAPSSGERETAPPPARRAGTPALKARRPPYFVGAILITAAASLFMATRLREPRGPIPAPPRPSIEAPPPEAKVAVEPQQRQSDPPRSTASPVEESSAKVAAPASDAQDAAAGELAGVDPSGLRAIVIQTARSREWESGEAALLALIDKDPASFGREEVFDAARDLLVGLERDNNADKAFDAIVSRLGGRGVDLLYELVESKGGSRAATRANELLHKDELKARESPAIQIALDLRDASCVDKLSLFDRAVQDGDGRALVVLETLGTACFRKSRELERAISKLKSKLIKP